MGEGENLALGGQCFPGCGVCVWACISIRAPKARIGTLTRTQSQTCEHCCIYACRVYALIAHACLNCICNVACTPGLHDLYYSMYN